MLFVLLLGIISIAVESVPTGPARSVGVYKSNAKSAAEYYAKKCASCHGKDGRAKTFKARFNHARNLTDPEWQGEVSDERLFNSIMNGKGKMPSFGKKLSEQDINSLVAFIRALKK